MANVTWSMLLTESLVQGKTQYINRIPKSLLKGVENEQMEYLERCSKDGYIPKLETFKEDNVFLAQRSEMPLEVLHREFTKRRRNEVIAETVQNHIKENGGVDGLTEKFEEIHHKTRIPNPQVLAYSEFDRKQLDTDIIRIKTGIPHFDKIWGGCLHAGELVVLAAGVKSYKTSTLRLLTEFFYYGTEENPGTSVLLCSQEMSQSSMLSLMDFQRLGKNAGSTRGGIPDDIMGLMCDIQQTAKNYEQELYISPAVKTAQQVIDYWYTLSPRPNVVIIDGINLMGSNSENSYTSIGKEVEALKNFAIKENVIIIGATQLNRQGTKAGLGADHTDLAGSYSVAMWCDFLLGCVPVEIMLDNSNQPTRHLLVKPLLCRGVAQQGSQFLIEYRYTENEFIPIFKTIDPNWSPDELYLTNSEISQKKTSATELINVLGKDTANDVTDALESIANSGTEIDLF